MLFSGQKLTSCRCCLTCLRRLHPRADRGPHSGGAGRGGRAHARQRRACAARRRAGGRGGRPVARRGRKPRRGRRRLWRACGRAAERLVCHRGGTAGGGAGATWRGARPSGCTLGTLTATAAQPACGMLRMHMLPSCPGVRACLRQPSRQIRGAHSDQRRHAMGTCQCQVIQ